jgi:hypothetical protein
MRNPAMHGTNIKKTAGYVGYICPHHLNNDLIINTHVKFYVKFERFVIIGCLTLNTLSLGSK